MIFFDSHCHLQDERYGDTAGAVIGRARNAGVKNMSCCAASFHEWDRIAVLASSYNCVIPSFGIHPWYLDSAPENWPDMLRGRLLSMPSGVGETGLDFTIEKFSRDMQENFFRAHIRIANELDRPVSIHCRKAWQRLIGILNEECPRCRGLVHSYSGAAEMVPMLESLGLYISFSGAITGSNNKRGCRSVKAVSAGRLLIETDSPDLLPVNALSSINEPANILLVAEAVAKLRETTVESLSGITCANGMSLFENCI
jgi:TatD DNase family protein